MGAHLVLSSSLLIRAAIVLAHAYIVRCIGCLAFALSLSDGLGGIAHGAAARRVCAHDCNDESVNEMWQLSVGAIVGAFVGLKRDVERSRACGEDGKLRMGIGSGSRRKRDGKDVWRYSMFVGLMPRLP